MDSFSSTSYYEQTPYFKWFRNSIKRGYAGHKRLDWLFKRIHLELIRLNKDFDLPITELMSNPQTFRYLKDFNRFMNDNEDFVFYLVGKEEKNEITAPVGYVEGEEKILFERDKLAQSIVDEYFGDNLPEKKGIVKEKLESLFNDPTFDFEAYLKSPMDSKEASRLMETLTSTVSNEELIKLHMREVLKDLPIPDPKDFELEAEFEADIRNEKPGVSYKWETKEDPKDPDADWVLFAEDKDNISQLAYVDGGKKMYLQCYGQEIEVPDDERYGDSVREKMSRLEDIINYFREI